MPRPQPLVALHGAVDFNRFIPFDSEPSAPPLQVNDLLVMRRAAGGPNVLVSVGDIQTHGGSVNIADLLGGVNDDLLFRIAGVWTGTLSSGLKYDGVEMTFTNDGIVMDSGAAIVISAGSGISLDSGAGVNIEDAGEVVIDGTGSVRGSNTKAAQLVNEAASLTNPTLIPDRSQINTGVVGRGSGFNEVGFSILGQTAIYYQHILGDILQHNQNRTGITASVVQTQAGATQLNGSYNEVATVANSGDACKTPFLDGSGIRLVVINNGANDLQLFPFPGVDIGAGVNVSRTMVPGFVGVWISRTSAIMDTLFFGSPTGGGGSVTFPELVFNASDFENPNNADWDVNALAPAVADSNNNALTVRAFDDTVVEGIGGFMNLPTGAVNFTLNLVGRAETAPPGTRQVRFSLHVREIPDDAGVTAPPWITANLANIDIPTNENFQFDSQTFTFAFFGFAADELIQFELVRVNTIVGTDLSGDYDLLQMRVTFA